MLFAVGLFLAPAWPTEAYAIQQGMTFTEGVTYDTRRKEWLWSDIPANVIYRSKLEEPLGVRDVFRQPSGNANGNLVTRNGDLYSCRHGDRDVVLNGATVIAARWEGKRLNSPNDLTMTRRGVIYFTDPPYGLHEQTSDLGFNGVWRVHPKRPSTLEPVARDFERPNGIALSPRGDTLYVSDTARSHIRALALDAKGGVIASRIFAELPNPDGLKVDRKGNVWCTARDGVHIFTPKGDRIRVVKVADAPTNLAFGGRDGRDVVITAQSRLYRCRAPFPGL